MARLDPLLRYLKDKGGSDLHLVAGLTPRIRRSGSLREAEGAGVASDSELRKTLSELPEPRQWAEFERTRDLDFAYALAGVGRFRANYFEQQQGVGAVFRLIPETILSLEDINAPQVIRDLAELRRGLVLLTGPTGSGKSTTMAAVVNQINLTRTEHIITIEDPVEFVHENQRSVISHREVHRDTESFAGAVRAAIRQDPGVIVVGEMRDPNTISMALRAAEMGVLVLGTLHTNSASKTLDRLVDAFPAEEHDQVRMSLADAFAAVVAQLLIPAADGKGRHASHEVLLRTSGLPNVIRQGNTSMIRSIIQSGRNQGMQSMDDALAALVKEGKIEAAEALRRASDRKRFEVSI